MVLYSMLSPLNDDISPPNEDEDDILLNPEKLRNDESSPVGTICKTKRWFAFLHLILMD